MSGKECGQKTARDRELDCEAAERVRRECEEMEALGYIFVGISPLRTGMWVSSAAYYAKSEYGGWQ